MGKDERHHATTRGNLDEVRQLGMTDYNGTTEFGPRDPDSLLLHLSEYVH